MWHDGGTGAGHCDRGVVVLFYDFFLAELRAMFGGQLNKAWHFSLSIFHVKLLRILGPLNSCLV